LECSHKCIKKCNLDCYHLYAGDKKKGYVTPCKTRVNKIMKCGHSEEIDCGLPADTYFYNEGCMIECNKMLECGHLCPLKCSDCFGKQFHGSCTHRCKKVLVCNHSCQD